MKKLILVVFLATISAVTFAQDKGIKFSTGTFKEVSAEAASAKKMVFIDFYTSWCGPCKFLSANIFPDAEVGKYMNPLFVSMKVDAEKGEGVSLAKTYGIKSYPTLLILDASGKEIGRIVGADKTPEAFIQRVKGTLAQAKK